MNIVILDGYTINPGDNPWSPVEAQGECTVYDRTPVDLVLERGQGKGHIDLGDINFVR